MSTVGFKQARRRYFRLFWPAMAVYILLILAGKFWLGRYEVEPLWLKAGTAVAVSLPVIGALVLMLRYAFETDEFQRRMQIEAMAISGVIIASAIFLTGFLQIYDVVPEFSVFWFGPAFMLVLGVVALIRGGRQCL